MSTNTKTKTKAKAKAVAFDAATSLKKINSNIALLRKNSKAFQAKVQETLILIARHAHNTGDCSAAARLMNDALPGWSRRGPICIYIADFTPIRVIFKGGVANAKFAEKDGEGQRPPFDIDGMVATPFWDHKSMRKDVELPIEIDDIDTDVIKLAERLAKRLKDKKIAPTAIDHTRRMIAALKGTVSAVRAEDRAQNAPGAPEPAKPTEPAKSTEETETLRLLNAG